MKTPHGRKAAFLSLLTKYYPDRVPRFVTVSFADCITNWATVRRRLNENATHLISSSLSEKQYKRVREGLFKSARINGSYQSNVRLFIKTHEIKTVSVRTSSTLEDLLDSSFAGQYTTVLDITPTTDRIEKAIRTCLESMYSVRVVRYAQARGVDSFTQDGSVIIQEMFYGAVSGVLFSENGNNQMELQWTPSRRNTTVEGGSAEKSIINKLLWPHQLPKKLPTGVNELIACAYELEKRVGGPVDIEWAATDDDLALLQVRPITKTMMNYTIEWDNTNIAENYPGITLPLTYSFIRGLYARVYPEFLRLIGTREKDIKDKHEVFSNMLGYLDGNVYYNISNWYHLIACLPGYTLNKQFFESMLMPARKKIEEEYQPQSFANRLRLYGVGIRFLLLLLRLDVLAVAFTKTYTRRYLRYSSIQWSHLSSPAITESIAHIEDDLLSLWAVPILNDFRVMVFHGILKKWYVSARNKSLYLSFISGLYEPVSLEPLYALSQLAQNVRPLIKKYDHNMSRIKRALSTDNALRSAIASYLKAYGQRCPGELKLESKRFAEDYNGFIELILQTAGGGKVYTKKNPSTHLFIPDITGGFMRRQVMRLCAPLVLYHVREGIAARERFRLYRAGVFGIARSAYCALGDRLVHEKLLQKRDDIFYLTNQELYDIVNGHAIDYQVKNSIARRRTLFNKYNRKQSGRRIVGTGLIAPMHREVDDGETNDTQTLTGLGVSSGKVKGTVVVMPEFDKRISVAGKILVTTHTDPGWTLLFVQAKGVIVERGNALSHASIVARELGIPAVVAVPNACKFLSTGTTVVLDGTRGHITIV